MSRVDVDNADVLPAGAVLAAGYTVLEHLRRGRRLDVYDIWSDERACRCVGKTVRPGLTDDDRAITLLEVEGRLLAETTHPHIVRLYDRVSTSGGGAPALILETLTGSTLDHLVGGWRRLRSADVAQLGLHLCSALHDLHRRGWLHLDVTPGNVIATGGRAVLIDLSMAQPIGGVGEGGTFDYMAPEQANGTPVSEATDVWGLAATLYAAAARRRPYGEHTTVSGRDATYPQSTATPEPLRRSIRTAAALRDLITECLSLDPGLRPPLSEVSKRLAQVEGRK